MLANRRRLAAQLDDELVGWLTTVSPDGQPQSSVVWFLRDGDDLLVYSKPDAGKLRNIVANPNVAFNLRGDELGDSMATFEATASMVDSPTPPHSGSGLSRQVPRTDQPARLDPGALLRRLLRPDPHHHPPHSFLVIRRHQGSQSIARYQRRRLPLSPVRWGRSRATSSRPQGRRRGRLRTAPSFCVESTYQGVAQRLLSIDGGKSSSHREGRDHVNECYSAGYHHKGRTFG